MMKPKVKVTIGKYNGNDAYSNAVFVDGRLFVCGLSKSEARYYAKQADERYNKKAGA